MNVPVNPVVKLARSWANLDYFVTADDLLAEGVAVVFAKGRPRRFRGPDAELLRARLDQLAGQEEAPSVTPPPSERAVVTIETSGPEPGRAERSARRGRRSSGE